MQPILTVFTPTYNRAYILGKCYESMKRQTCKDFIWMIIDDGSTDDTKTLVESWIGEGQVIIEYYYQANQGMHGAHNTAYTHIQTELNVCIDSDDSMTEDAVEKIIKFWEAKGHTDYAGIIALDGNLDEEIIGTILPVNKATTTLGGFYREGGKGDKKLIYRTEVIKTYPSYPLFEGEKYVGLNYKYMMIDQEYELLIMNEVVCLVEYQADGSSLNMVHQYRKNPRGFAELRKVAMCCTPNLKDRFREAIHYVSSSFICKNKKFIQESPCKGLTMLAIPLGALLYFFVMHTSQDTVMKQG